jgi:formylglycine-generating enzyme required for sulfatase activity
MATPHFAEVETISTVPAADLKPPPASVAIAPEARFPEKNPRSIWIGAVLAGLVLVAAIAGFLILRPTKAHNANGGSVHGNAASPPPVYSDAHGRMLLVSAGPFHFGEKGIADTSTIDLPAFYLDETEVSRAEYRRFCEATGHAAPQGADYNLDPDYPVSGISYDDALAYASWAGKRLPTEAEWEKAARGTDERAFPWGDAAWTSGIPNHLQPVTSEPARRSPYGAYNMAGNVWEWTATPFTPQPSDVAEMKHLVGEARFSSKWQVMKGGSFSPGGNDNFAISKRRGLPTDARSPWIGFRCVRDVATGS